MIFSLLFILFQMDWTVPPLLDGANQLQEEREDLQVKVLKLLHLGVHPINNPHNSLLYNYSIVKLQTQSEGLGVDFTFAMEQEEQEQQEQEQEQASPKFLGWDGTRGLKFGNLT